MDVSGESNRVGQARAHQKMLAQGDVCRGGRGDGVELDGLAEIKVVAWRRRVGVGGVGQYGDKIPRLRINDLLAVNGSPGELGGNPLDRGVPPADRGGRVIPISAAYAGGSPRASGGRSGVRLAPHLCVGPVALDIGVIASGTGDIQVPASKDLVVLGVLHLRRDHHIVWVRRDKSEDGRADAHANGGTDSPGGTRPARPNRAICIWAIHVGEPEIIARADLNAVDPNAHIIVSHTANLGGSSCTLGLGFSSEGPQGHQK